MKQHLYLSKSTRKHKKFMIKFINPLTNKENTVHFGDDRYLDYTTYPPNEKLKDKQLYLTRHNKEEWTNPLKPSTLSRYLLWNKPTLKSSIDDMSKRFNIIIHY